MTPYVKHIDDEGAHIFLMFHKEAHVFASETHSLTEEKTHELFLLPVMGHKGKFTYLQIDVHLFT